MIQVEAQPRPFPHDGLSDAVALLVIDMQRDFLDPRGYLASIGHDIEAVRAAIKPARHLLDAARAAGIDVLHTRQGIWPDLRELPPYSAAPVRAGDSAVGREGPLGRFLIRGEPGFQIIDELAPAPGER